MSTALTSRLLAPLRKAAAAPASAPRFAQHLYTTDAAHATSVAATRSWAWRNLTPRTRRYVGLAVAVGGVVDLYVVYNYFPGLFRQAKDKDEHESPINSRYGGAL